MDVGGLAVAVGVARRVLVCVEAEAAVEAAREDAVEALLGVALVAPHQQRGDRRQIRLAVDPGQPAAVGVGGEEVVVSTPVGDQPDDDQDDEHGDPGGGAADRDVAGAGSRDQRDDDQHGADDQRHRVGEQVAQVLAAGVVGVVGNGRELRLRRGDVGVPGAGRRRALGVLARHPAQPICKRGCSFGVAAAPARHRPGRAEPALRCEKSVARRGG